MIKNPKDFYEQFQNFIEEVAIKYLKLQEQGGVKGEKGEKGDPFTFEDFTPEQLESLRGPQGLPGRDGLDGKDGSNGSDGATFKPTVNANGDLSWTNDQGLANPETVNIKGPKGDTGQDGKAFTFADFTPEQIESLKVKGDDGLDGKDGQDGKTPVLGTDYFTEADKQEIVNSVLASLVDGDKEAY